MLRVPPGKTSISNFSSLTASNIASARTEILFLLTTSSEFVNDTVVTTTPPRLKISTVVNASVSSKPVVKNKATVFIIKNLLFRIIYL